MRAGLRLAVAALALVSFPSTPTGRYERTGKDKMRLAVAQRRTRTSIQRDAVLLSAPQHVETRGVRSIEIVTSRRNGETGPEPEAVRFTRSGGSFGLSRFARRPTSVYVLHGASSLLAG
jgi:hypothetical protein